MEEGRAMIVSNEREERQQWLNSLRVGDEVAVDTGNRYYLPFKIGKITKITPSRMFEVDCYRYKFNNDGRERGNFYGSKIIEASPKVKETILRSEVLDHIKDIDFKSLTTQQLLDVLKIINPDVSK